MIKNILAWMCDYDFPIIPINRRAAICTALRNMGITSPYVTDAVLNGDSATAYLAVLEAGGQLPDNLRYLIQPIPKWQTQVGLFLSKGANECECCLGWRILAAFVVGVAIGAMLH
jgi:hypothetical protein